MATHHFQKNSTSNVIVQIFLNRSLNVNEQNLKTNQTQKTFRDLHSEDWQMLYPQIITETT